MKERSFYFVVLLILITSFGLRFARYSDRWGLAYDQTHDALVARHAISSKQIPLLGPFSSAGPFQTSGVWYWFIMAGTILNRSSVTSPWVLLTLLYVLFTCGMILLGKILVDKTLGIIAGILTAFSTAQIAQSVNLTNQSPVALTSFCALFSFVMYGKTLRLRYLFFLGFFVSLSASIHLQGISLMTLIVPGIFFVSMPSARQIFIVLAGIFLPLTPILLFDTQHHFINTNNMIHYVLVDQYRISLDVLGRRWKTFLSVFLPYEWSHIIGGKFYIGGLLMIGSFMSSFLFGVHKHKKILWGIVTSTLLMITILRYTRTPLFSSYVVFLHPFILLLTSLLIYTVYKKSYQAGILLAGVVLLFSIQKDIQEINYGTNLSDQRGRRWLNFLDEKYKNTSFSVYDYHRKAESSSLLLSLYLDANNQISSSGKKLTVTMYPPEYMPVGKLILTDGDKAIFDASDVSDSSLKNLGWARVNPEDIYNETEFWIDR